MLLTPEKVEAIVKIPVSISVTEVRMLIGIASWYRKFIPNFSSTTAPLTALLYKNQRFVWDEQCQSAMKIIKGHLVSSPILSRSNFELPFSVQTDASDYDKLEFED